MTRPLGEARKSGVDILLFGHTHRACCQQLEDGLWVMNPGASRTSYWDHPPGGGRHLLYPDQADLIESAPAQHGKKVSVQ